MTATLRLSAPSLVLVAVAALATPVPATERAAALTCAHESGQPTDHLEQACTRELRKDGLTSDRRAEAYLLRGFSRFNKKRYWRAVGDLEAGLRLRPNSSRHHRLLSATAFRRGEVRRAFFHAEHAVRLDPRSANGHSNLADLLIRTGQLKTALPSLTAAITNNPNDYWARYWRARLAFDARADDRALEDIEIIVEADSNRAAKSGTVNLGGSWVDVLTAAYMLKGQILMRQQAYKQAEALAAKLSSDAATATNLAYQANLLLSMPVGNGMPSRLTEALELAERATKLNPRYAYGWNVFATTLQYSKRHLDALAAFERFESMAGPSSGLAGSLWLKSRVLQDLGRTVEAVDTGVKAFSLAMVLDHHRLDELTQRLRKLGYWAHGELPEAISPELVDAITACRIDPQCW